MAEIRTIGTTDIGGNEFLWGSRTYIMGVINVTSDSFSGDGIGTDVGVATSLGLKFQKMGADIVDVGGESTKPPSVYTGAVPTSLQEELGRVIPTVKALSAVLEIPISVDTYKAEVARKAIKAGAAMINDVRAFEGDPEMAHVVSEADVPVVLMHNQEGNDYDDLVPGVIKALERSIEKALKAGVDGKKIIVDPGIGFGKNVRQNLEILRRLNEFTVLRKPLLLGTSRKSTIGYVLNLEIDQRVEGTAATVALSIAGGADIVRVHDVKEMVRVAKMSDAIVRGVD